MGGKSERRVDVPDPQEIINAEMRANRVNTSGPFGSVNWQGNTQVTNLSPEMEALQQRMMGLAMQDSERVEMPSFINDIASGVMGRIGERYGAGDKPQPQQQMPQPQVGPSMNVDFSVGPAQTNPGQPPQSFGQFQAMPGLNQQMNQRPFDFSALRNFLQER